MPKFWGIVERTEQAEGRLEVEAESREAAAAVAEDARRRRHRGIYRRREQGCAEMAPD